MRKLTNLETLPGTGPVNLAIRPSTAIIQFEIQTVDGWEPMNYFQYESNFLTFNRAEGEVWRVNYANETISAVFINEA